MAGGALVPLHELRHLDWKTNKTDQAPGDDIRHLAERTEPQLVAASNKLIPLQLSCIYMYASMCVRVI
jgi:hypothetical protein